MFSKGKNKPSPLTTRAPIMSTSMTARAKQALKGRDFSFPTVMYYRAPPQISVIK